MQEHANDTVLVEVKKGHAIREDRRRYVNGEQFTTTRGRARSLPVTILRTLEYAAPAPVAPPTQTETPEKPQRRQRKLRHAMDRLHTGGFDRAG